MCHLSCQVNIYVYIGFYLCLVIIIMFIYHISIFMFVSCPEISIYKNYVCFESVETNCGKSMIHFYAIWGPCWHIFFCKLLELWNSSVGSNFLVMKRGLRLNIYFRCWDLKNALKILQSMCVMYFNRLCFHSFNGGNSCNDDTYMNLNSGKMTCNFR